MLNLLQKWGKFQQKCQCIILDTKMGKVLAEMLLVTCACYRNGEVTAEMPMCYRNGGQLLQKCTCVIPVTEMGGSFSRNSQELYL